MGRAAALDAAAGAVRGRRRRHVTTSYDGDPPALARTTDGPPVGAAEVRPGDGGELLVRGPELFAGYTDPDETVAAMASGGWYRTGDLARIDGWVTIVGRLRDGIVRGGEDIAVAELEAVLEATRPSARPSPGSTSPRAGTGSPGTV